MEIFNSLNEWNSCEETVIVLGNFDGVHLGHKRLIESCVDRAKALGLKSLCFTFSNHPKNMFAEVNGGKDDELLVRFISSSDEKLKYIEKLGIDFAISIPFNEKIMKVPAKDFATHILAERLNAKAIFCGFNYRFGYKAGGDVDLLMETGRQYGIEIDIQPAVKINGEIVSSSLVRERIESGKMEEASMLLGRPYTITGKVTRGNGIGKKIGSPTANINIEAERIVPPNGVYYSGIEIGGSRYRGISNLGVKPTIGNYAKSIETNIFGFEGELYNCEISVGLYKWKRPEIKFSNTSELAEQIKSDAASAAEWWRLKEDNSGF